MPVMFKIVDVGHYFDNMTRNIWEYYYKMIRYD